MSLRMFHLVFIGVSVVLAAFVAAWAVQQYQAAQAVELRRRGGVAGRGGALMASTARRSSGKRGRL